MYRNPEDIHLEEFAHSWDKPLGESKFEYLPGASNRIAKRERRIQRSTEDNFISTLLRILGL